MAITIGGAFFLFTGIAIVAWIFHYTMLPETQGKTLEEIEGSFGNFWRKPNATVREGVNHEIQLSTNDSTFKTTD
jgi:hypothetical protein